MAYRKLGVTCKHRKSMLANEVISLFKNGKIETTITRAKEVSSIAEKMITYGKKGDLISRRKAIAYLHNNVDIVKKLFDEIAKRYDKRNGGYTRILKKGERQGDDALIVILELV